MTAGGDLVVGNNQVFPFEEVKRDPLRFSTNKVKRDIEMEVVKTEKEGLKLTGLETLKVEQETAKAVMEKDTLIEKCARRVIAHLIIDVHACAASFSYAAVHCAI